MEFHDITDNHQPPLSSSLRFSTTAELGVHNIIVTKIVLARDGLGFRD